MSIRPPPSLHPLPTLPTVQFDRIFDELTSCRRDHATQPRSKSGRTLLRLCLCLCVSATPVPDPFPHLVPLPQKFGWRTALHADTRTAKTIRALRLCSPIRLIARRRICNSTARRATTNIAVMIWWKPRMNQVLAPYPLPTSHTSLPLDSSTRTPSTPFAPNPPLTFALPHL
jgi:hypothetical protein